ncbi:MAG: nucleotidyltransferase [Thermoanaerobaculia bacterium]
MDTEKLLRFLNARKVRYVVIGATVFPVHGYARATLDIDVFIESTEDNARRTLEALADFGYDVLDLTVEDLQTKKILIRESVLQTDIHPFVAGVSFDDVWRRRVEGRLGGTPTAFASLEDLILMKEAAGRPKDLEDLRVLKRLKERGPG